jgi:cysteine desulfurase/selenocysteine lyase
MDTVKGESLSVQKVRSDFPILKREISGYPLVYFDNAATTQKPTSVIEAVKSFYENKNANVHRGVHLLSYEATLLYEDAHRKVAKFIGARSEREIIFTRNATEALNLVAYAWGLQNLKEGDEVLLTVMEHHSNIVPWQFLRDYKGIVLKFVDVRDDGTLDMEDFEKKLTEKTKLVGIIHVSNVLGTINPVEEITKRAKEIGALVLVDGAQSVPHLPVNVEEIGCDFLAASGHKMLGPSGTGFLYAREDILEEMNPFLYGGDMIMEVTLEGATWNELPWKFEAGTPNISGGVALGSAVDYLTSLGMEWVYSHERELTSYALEKMSEVRGIKLYGPDIEKRVGVISFNIEGIHPHDIAGFLNDYGITIRSGHHCAQPLLIRMKIPGTARVSFYVYNTKEEIDFFVEKLKEVVELFNI